MRYRRVVFPKLRRAADEVDACGFKAGHVYVLCTSYRTDPRVTYAVYEGLLRNIADYGAPTTVFAAISDRTDVRSEEHTSELQSLMRISYAVFCLKKKKTKKNPQTQLSNKHPL